MPWRSRGGSPFCGSSGLILFSNGLSKLFSFTQVHAVPTGAHDTGLTDIEIRPTHRVHQHAVSAIIRAAKPNAQR